VFSHSGVLEGLDCKCVCYASYAGRSGVVLAHEVDRVEVGNHVPSESTPVE
jgi:hypothetical protein